MRCYACQAELKPDGRPEDAAESPILIDGEPPADFDPWADHYQFDNALWIGFHGGYGMFTDNMGVSWPVNGMDRFDDEGNEDPAWRPEFAEKRMLKGADHECVICHDCAHEACDKLPWLKNLIDPWRSHAHATAYTEAHPEHYGWDYSIADQPDVRTSDQLRRPIEHELPPWPPE